MKKLDLINEMVNKGICRARAKALLNPYSEILAFKYNSVYKTAVSKYVSNFGLAYSDYGIYVFYDIGTFNIQYIGEAASEPFSKRLTQHFNNSHGGLRHTKPHAISTLNGCEVLILYGKYNATQARETHLDEDLLIGTFRPPLNDR